MSRSLLKPLTAALLAAPVAACSAAQPAEISRAKRDDVESLPGVGDGDESSTTTLSAGQGPTTTVAVVAPQPEAPVIEPFEITTTTRPLPPTTRRPSNSIADGVLPVNLSDEWYRAHTGTLPPPSVSRCESGNDPTNKTNPRYRGKWQFGWWVDAQGVEHGTWVAMGGSGDPADASEAEQDYRASLAWDDGDGAGHWEQCL